MLYNELGQSSVCVKVFVIKLKLKFHFMCLEGKKSHYPCLMGMTHMKS